MEATPALNGRQLWANPSPTADVPKECRPLRLPSGGLLNIGNSTIITLDEDAVYEPGCADYPTANVSSSGFNISVIDDMDPFYASTLPQIYAIATATIVSYMLLIILFITPRTFFVGGAGGGNGFLGRRGMISGSSGSTSIIGIGSRPWLQKVAALTVAVSLTIATVDTLQVAEQQYNAGYQDVAALTDKVADDLQIRVVRVISDTCLWLAQAQTLIRLFPRHREKVIIKWTAFALILLDLIFSILNSFVYGNVRARPRTFVDTVPALNYLFAIALSILYMAWVLYYSISKRRFAFYHPKMRNICLMAILSLTAIIIPVVFFVLDIASPRVSGWGNYVRWVGAAAASVVVWEWVERIEALERDENKDGILGRELFDGDEMLRDTPAANANRRARSHSDDQGSTGNHGRSGVNDEGHDDGGNTELRGGVTSAWGGVAGIANRLRQKHIPQHSKSSRKQRRRGDQSRGHGLHILDTGELVRGVYSLSISPPPMTDSPISRADTTSAASTVYRAHYHPASEATPPIQEASESSEGHTSVAAHATPNNDPPIQQTVDLEVSRSRLQVLPRSQGPSNSWRRMPNPFRRQRSSPPPEVSQAIATSSQGNSGMGQNVQSEAKPAANRFEQWWQNRKPKNEEIPLPVTIIPWQPRGRAYLDKVETTGPGAENRAKSIAPSEAPSNDQDALTPPVDITPHRDHLVLFPSVEDPNSLPASPQQALTSDGIATYQLSLRRAHDTISPTTGGPSPDPG